MRKWAGVALAAVAALLGIAGCGVPAGGVIGLTMDSNGEVVAVVQMCEGHIDGATVYLADTSGAETPNDQILGRWEVTPAATGFSRFGLANGGDGWRPVGALVPRDPDTRYTIYGWSKDNSWSAMHLDFSDRELAALQPGTVLVPPVEAGSETNETWPMAKFQAKACDTWF